jgi:hypothetical protein
MSRITVTKLTKLVLQRRDLLNQLHNIDVIITRRPSIVKQLDDIEALIGSHRAHCESGAPTPGKAGRPLKYGFEISAAVADLTRTGLSEREIGDKLGIPHQSVANMQKREGVRSTSKTGGARTPYGPEMIAAVKMLVAEGVSKRKIAKELGIPPGSVDTLKNKL